MELKYLSNSKKGIRRKKNQDRILIIDSANYYLFSVFDGVSSLPTSHVFISNYSKKLKTNLTELASNGQNLGSVLYETHRQLIGEGASKGMSTLSALFYAKGLQKTYYVNIGDSRIYRFTNQFIEKITSDDAINERPNILTKCLGLHTLTLDDFEPTEIINTSNFLICTDGFYTLMLQNLKEYFQTYNFKRLRNIEKKLAHLQRQKNTDDSSYILIKNEV